MNSGFHNYPRTAIAILFAVSGLVTQGRVSGADPVANYDADVLPVLKKHCFSCHNEKKPRGGVVLDKYKNLTEIKKDIKLWERVADNLRTGDMPPSGKPKPTPKQLDVVNRWLDSQVFEFTCTGDKDPGKVTLRRLNRLEYNNTIRDLLGVENNPSEEFPADDVGYGFDHIGDVLTMPPILMEKYLDAAEDVLEAFFKNRALVNKHLKLANPSIATKQDITRIFSELGNRAYRRPITKDEVAKLEKLSDSLINKGEKPIDGLKAAMLAMLVSPYFLFHVELDPDPNSTTSHDVNQFELASRLSYFLWSSMPDEPLFQLARENKLREKGVVEEQIARMLKDPKAKTFTRNFPEQWLQLRNLKTVQPDKTMFPTFNDQLRDDMAREAEMFFEHITKENKSILELLDSDYTFANSRLGRHYGLKMNGYQEEFKKVTFTDNRRGGVVTQAGVLTITSNPTRTSPVKRGKWVMENILGTPPPPPPPNVEELKEDGKALTGTLRERMEQHRSNPNCASCHQKMDAIGFGLENFDPVGVFREKEHGKTIDPSGELPGTGKFANPSELRKLLLSKSELFARCFTEKMLTYATGRGMERADNCVIDALVEDLKKDGYKMQDLIVAIVKSEPFQKRKAKRGPKT